jgi:hypothetical protein
LREIFWEIEHPVATKARRKNYSKDSQSSNCSFSQ